MIIHSRSGNSYYSYLVSFFLVFCSPASVINNSRDFLSWSEPAGIFFNDLTRDSTISHCCGKFMKNTTDTIHWSCLCEAWFAYDYWRLRSLKQTWRFGGYYGYWPSLFFLRQVLLVQRNVSALSKGMLDRQATRRRLIALENSEIWTAFLGISQRTRLICEWISLSVRKYFKALFYFYCWVEDVSEYFTIHR